ncbi:MAG: CoA-binding protein [Rhodospirillaceae bacterium]|jgi:predicted CoA-binding protein
MHDLNYPDSFIRTILETTHTIALVGASVKPARASFRVMRFLLDKGYRVFPINPQYAGDTIHDLTVFASLFDIPEKIDMVDIFRRSNEAGAVIEEAISIGAKTVWTQLEVIDFKAAERAEKAGLQVIMDRCPAIEYPRLMGS